MEGLLSLLDAFGVDLTEVPGWETRKASNYAWGPLIGIIVHHTASSNTTLDLVKNGRVDLSGPLYHIYTESNPEKKTWLVAYGGRANHAGLGDIDVFNAVGSNTPLPDPNQDDMGGNQWFLSVSTEGPPINPWCYDQLVNTVGALCTYYSWNPAWDVIGHKEWTSRKVDPSFSMDQFRADVTKRIDEVMSKTHPDYPGYKFPDNEDFWPSWITAIEEKIVTIHTNPDATVTYDKLVVFLDRAGVADGDDTGDGADLSGYATKAWVKSNSLNYGESVVLAKE
jgi:hypothetical protein